MVLGGLTGMLERCYSISFLESRRGTKEKTAETSAGLCELA